MLHEFISANRGGLLARIRAKVAARLAPRPTEDELKTVDEFHRFNRCLDDATAEAVTEYTRQREHSFTDGETQRSGILAHEMRNRVSIAAMAF